MNVQTFDRSAKKLNIDNMIEKEEFSEFLKQGGELLEDMLLHRLSLRKIYYSPSTYYYNVRKFTKAGLIKPKKRKKYANEYILTNKGIKLIKRPSVKKRKVDGNSTIIIFDIPETKTRQRKIFRRYLLHNGYIQFQKSALISPFEVTAELRELIEELNIKEYVKIISGKISYI